MPHYRTNPGAQPAAIEVSSWRATSKADVIEVVLKQTGRPVRFRFDQIIDRRGDFIFIPLWLKQRILRGGSND